MSLKNGHAPAKTLFQSPGAICSRRYRDRRKRGTIVLKPIVIEPDLAQALVACGWLHGIEASNRAAVEHALFGLVLRSLSNGVSPSEKPLLEVDLGAIQDAWIWSKPGSAVTPENAAKALSNVAKCSALVGFGPVEFGERLKAMAGIG
jgi:hypothetical protein